MKRAPRHLGPSIFSKHDIEREKAVACPSFEALEPRVLLSGTVHASVVHGILGIRGDAAANVIFLDQTGLNEVRISGASGTAINKQAGSVLLRGVTHGVNIRMGDGNDSVIMSNLDLPGNVSVDGQGGDDILTIDNSIFHGAVHLYGGAGNDIIQIAAHGAPLGPPTVFDGRVSISLGAGDDTLQVGVAGRAPLDHVDAGGEQAALPMGVAGQTGNRAVFADKVRFDGGAGHDTLLNFDGNTYTMTSPFRIMDFESNTTAPDVISSEPANAATGVAINQKLSVTFSSVMDRLTITTATFTLKRGNTRIAGRVSYIGTTATFSPDRKLAPNTTFTATVTTGAQDLVGNALAGNFTWTFTTGATPDTTAPTVSSTDPLSGATGVAIYQITATFSEAMDPLTISAANVTVTAPGAVPVIGTVAYVGTTMTFTPWSNLAPDTTFTATISGGASGVKDLAGNSLASDEVWTFTTGT